MERLSRIHFMSQPDKLKPLRDAVRMLAEKENCTQDDQDCLVMAINEACMNVMQHAYGKDREGEIILELWRHENELIIRIYDFAKPVDASEIHSRNLDDVRPGGLGVHFMLQSMDSVEYKPGPDGVGNLLEMHRTIKSHQRSQAQQQGDESA